MRRWFAIGFVMLVSFSLLLLIYTVYLYFSVKHVYTEKIYEPLTFDVSSSLSHDQPIIQTKVDDLLIQIEQPIMRIQPDDISQKEPLSLLILGIDEYDREYGRSDTIMLVILNPEQRKSLLFNIPRDTRTEIVDRGKMDKINHAYAFGGIELSIQTIEHFIQIPIDYYVYINMSGFVQLIDAIGGIEIDNPVSFTSYYEFPQGPLHLNGDQALDYTRMRYQDPRGDLGRNERQRKVLKQIINKGLSPIVLGKIDRLTKQLSDYLKTNVSFDDLEIMIKDYQMALDEVEEVEIEGDGQIINDIYYYVVSQEERERISSLIKQYLELTD